MLNVSGPSLRTDPAGRPHEAAGWVLTGTGVALTLAAAAVADKGFDRAGLELGLRLTARVAFLAFWPAYSASALVKLFGGRLEPLRRRARALGLTFAAVMAVHLGLVVGICAIRAPPPARVFIIFGPGVAFILALAGASVRSISQAISPQGWWILRNVGMNYLAFDFLVDFTDSEPLSSAMGLVEYVPFAALAAAGPALRLAAYLKQRRWSRFGPRSEHLH
jgi:hypothetical protein